MLFWLSLSPADGSPTVEYIGGIVWSDVRSDLVTVRDLSSIEMDADRRSGSPALPVWDVRVRSDEYRPGLGYRIVCPD